jgi:hypothetical protein
MRSVRSPFGFRKPIRIYPNPIRGSDTPLSRVDIGAPGKRLHQTIRRKSGNPKVADSVLIPNMFVGICTSRLRDEPDSL